MDDITKLLDEIDKRDKILSENPEIKKYQDKIDEALEGVEDPEQRVHIIMTFVNSKYAELLHACNNFYKEFTKIKNYDKFKRIKQDDDFAGKVAWSK